jgi:nucleoside phosphorylase
MRQLPTASSGPVFGTEKIVATPAEKRALGSSSHCLIVDMESQCVAEVASAHHVPFAVVRVVVDRAQDALPPAALVPLKKNGAVDGCGVLLSLLSQPSQFPALFRLGRDNAEAMRQLKTVARSIL